MPNKTHKGIFLDTTLRKGTSYNSIKTTQCLVKKKKKTTKTNKPPTKKPNQPVLNQAALQQNMEQWFKLENTSKFDLKSQCKEFWYG